MTITNEAQLANGLETLLRLGLDYLGIIDHYDRILVALSALQVYSDKMEKCATVDDLLAYIVDACEIDSVRDALRDTIQTNKGGETRGVSDYVDTVAEVAHFLRKSEIYDLAGMMYRMHANMQGKSNAGQVMTPPPYRGSHGATPRRHRGRRGDGYDVWVRDFIINRSQNDRVHRCWG